MNEEEQPVQPADPTGDVSGEPVSEESSNPFASPTSLSGSEQVILTQSREPRTLQMVIAILLGILAIFGIPIVFFVVCAAVAIGTADVLGDATIFLAFGVATLVACLLIFGIVVLNIRLLRQGSKQPQQVTNTASESGSPHDFT